MNIDFGNIIEQRIDGFKGGEGIFVCRIFENADIKVIKGYLEPHASIGMHTHDDSNETIYIFGGTGKVVEPGCEYPVTGGSCTFCPKGGSHSLVNTGDTPLYFMGVVPTIL